MSQQWIEYFMDVCHALKACVMDPKYDNPAKSEQKAFLEYIGANIRNDSVSDAIYAQFINHIMEYMSEAKSGFFVKKESKYIPGPIFLKPLNITLKSSTSVYSFDFGNVFKTLAVPKKKFGGVLATTTWLYLLSKMSSIFINIVTNASEEKISKQNKDMICMNTVHDVIPSPFGDRKIDNIRKLIGNALEHETIGGMIDEQFGAGKSKSIASVVKNGEFEFNTRDLAVKTSTAMEQGNIDPLADVIKNLIGQTLDQVAKTSEKDVNPNDQE